MNVYNGNVVTDLDGKATVELPDHFQALNRDFRYQLTVMGQFAQAIISEKISGNSFIIQTDKPSVEVSWQVTGVRHDPIALASRMSVEMDKSSNEVGKYMHPEAYGMPLTAGIDYHEERELAARSGLTEAFDPNDGE